MSEASSLQLLADKRDDLLLAEAIGWLHDYRKCSEEHLQTQSPNSKAQALPRTELAKREPNLQYISLALQSIQQNSCSVTNLLDDRTWNQSTLGRFLSRCHKTSHFDKQEPIGGQQTHPGAQISSPFGFEQPVGTNLTQNLWGLPWIDLGQVAVKRQNLRKQVSLLFSQTVADSRRPINEVDLWSWGTLVGALYKASLAGALLTEQIPEPRDLKWRLLAVRFDGFNYLLSATRIPDLLARQEILTNALERVGELLEVTYPLGSEVYRDENGSIFVVPDIPDLLEIQDGNNASLRRLILDAFAQGTTKNNSSLQIGGEMMPYIEMEQQAWWGQDPDWPNSNNDQLPKIGDLLAQKPRSCVEPKAIRRCWNGKAADVCPVCGLRPQGPSPKAQERKVCDICEQRRADRSKAWAMEQFNTTIWNDEVADTNGRFALIVGKLDLTYWLDGKLVRSLFLIAPSDIQNTDNKPVTLKNPSFARLRRIWETTRRFWQEIRDASLQNLTDDRRRLKIYLDRQPNLGPFHVYDLDLGATELSVVWVPSQNGKEGYLLTADNLSYIAHRLNAEKEVYSHPATSAIFMEDYLKEQFITKGQQPILLNSDASAAERRKNLLERILFRELAYQENRYATAISILAEPRSFMMIVPADKVLDIVECIQQKYAREMGKVCNRLPLHLGVVFAGRRMSLHAVLDAGRAMLAYQPQAQTFTVQSKKGADNALVLQLKGQDDRQISWRVPLKMGDNTTEDQWYPYAFLQTNSEPTNRSRRFQALNPWNGQEDWLVHAADLEEGDHIWFAPSTFDFLWLDAASRRFEIAYDQQGRRPARPTRPFYLEDLDCLDAVWDRLNQLTRTQLKQTLQTIETARERWFGSDARWQFADNKTFPQFVADTLANAGLLSLRAQRSSLPDTVQGIASPPEAACNDALQDKLIAAAVRGELTDLEELHLEILKEKKE